MIDGTDRVQTAAGAPTDIEGYDYDLPPSLIAQTPVEPRDSSRLLIVPPLGALGDRSFRDLPDFVQPNDLLVVNDSRVIPARLLGERAGGGRAELLLLRSTALREWECLAKPARRLPAGTALHFGSIAGRVLDRAENGSVIVGFDADDEALFAAGEMPLPPYIRAYRGDGERYQTVYARHRGSVAAPTAGLHFTDTLLSQLRERGAQVASVTLHVGVGTFRPLPSGPLAEQHMHAEWCEVPIETAQAICRAHEVGGRVIAVGTTCVRTLESAALASRDTSLDPFAGWTDLFITPGFRFQAVDALLTNFHLPRSSLLVLVSAFAGAERISQAYKHAIAEQYRFYSFGDAMLLL